MKLKQKEKNIILLKSYLFKKYSLILGIFILCGLSLTNVVSAETLTTTPKNNINAIDVTLNPVSPILNQSLTIEAKLLSQYKTEVGNNGFTARLFVCKDKDAQSCDLVQTTNGQGDAISNWQITPTSNNFSVGVNYINITFAYTTTAATYSKLLTTSFIASTSTSASVQINPQSQSVGNNKVTQIFSASYSEGSSGLGQPAKLIINCGMSGVSSNPASPITYPAPNFSCEYPLAASSFTITVTAVDATGKQLGNQGTYTLQLTGTEASQGVTPGSGKFFNPFAYLIANVISGLLGLVQELIYFIFFYFVAPFIQALLSIHPYTDAFVAIIYPGWEVVRNLCNILFIIAIIIIGLATVFRVESYQYKHLLVQLIIAALLINFSLVIAQAILGLADTVQAQFLPANVTVIRSLAGNLMVNNWRESFLASGNPFKDQGAFAGVVQPLFFVALSLGSFCVFVAIAIFLMIRIVALWMLLLVSPIAYACGVLPSTAQYRGQWWQNFIKYAFFTPFMAFFLNMTAIMANQFLPNGNSTTLLQSLSTTQSLSNSLDNSDVAIFVFRVASNILLLVFLVAGLKVADMAGVYGASGITGLAQKGIMLPFGAAGMGLKSASSYLGRRYNDWTVDNIRGHEPKISNIRKLGFAVFNPIATAKGFEKRSKELSHESEEKAAAVGLEVAEQAMTGGKKVIPRLLTFEKSEADKFTKELGHLNREGVVAAAGDIFQMKDNTEGKAMKRAIIQLAMEKGYIDDVTQDLSHEPGAAGDLYRKRLTQAGIVDRNAVNWKKDWFEMPDGTKRLRHDDRQRRAMYKAFFGEMHHGHLEVHDQAALRMITEEGEENGKKTGHFEYLKDGVLRPNGMYELRKDVEYEYEADGTLVRDADGYPKVLETSPEQIAAKNDAAAGRQFAAGEVAKMGDRAQANAAYHSFLSLSNRDKIIDKEFVESIARAIISNPGFMQQRTAPVVIFGSTTASEEQKEHLKTNNKVLIDEEVLNAMQQIANAEGGGGVLASMYSMAVHQKNDQKVTSKIMANSKITFDVKQADGTTVVQKDVKWDTNPDELIRLNSEAKKSEAEKAEQKAIRDEQKIARERSDQLSAQILEELKKLNSKP